MTREIMRLRVLKLVFSFFLSTLATFSFGQGWKEVYADAVKLYENQQFDEAFTQANRAYELSKTLDTKSQAYTLQLLTSICLESNRINEGVAVIQAEEDLFRQVEGDASETYGEALRKHALLLMQKGSFEPALEKCKASQQALKSGGKTQHVAYGNLLILEGELESLLKNQAAAKNSLEQGLKILSQFPDAGEDYLNGLILAAGVDMKLKDAAAAEKKYKLAITILEKNSLQNTPLYGETNAALAEALRLQGSTAESAKAIDHAAVTSDQKAGQLLRIAVDYHNKREMAKALESYRAAEKAEEEGKLVNNTAYSIHLNYGKALLESNYFTEAAIQLEKASVLCQKLYPAGAIERVLLDYALAELNLMQHNLSTAVDLYMKAAAGSINLPVAAKKQLAVRASAELLNEDQNEVAAEFLAAIGVDKVDAQTVKDLPDLIILYSQALLRSGKLTQARTVLQKALILATGEPARTNLELALVHVLERTGELQQARTLLFGMYKKQLTEDKKLEIAYQTARISQLMGKYQEAERGYGTVITALRQRKESTGPLAIQVYNSMAVLQTQLGNYEEAERMYSDILKTPDLPVEFSLTIRENLATIYEESLQLDKARVILEEVARQERQRLGNHNPDLAITLQNLATIYLKSGNLTEAKKLLTEAIKIDKETIGEESAEFATKAANLGVVEQQLGNLNEARKLFQRALEVHARTLGKEHPDYMYNAYNLAVSQQQANEAGLALPLFRDVSRFYRQEVADLFPAMSEKEKAAYYNKINDIVLAYLDFGLSNYNKFPELKGELYDFRLTTKALLYNASTRIRNTILSSGDTLLLARFTEWQKTKEELGKLSQLDAQEKIQAEDQILGLRQRVNELEKFLSEKSSAFSNETLQASVDWKKVKATLQKGQAAVEMIRLRLNLKNDSVIYAALVLRPEFETPEIVILPAGRTMESREFYYYRNCIKYQLRNERSYRMFWKPLEEKLNGVQTIFFSPDGIYSKISLVTLFDPATKTYLLDKIKVKLVNNTRELLNPGKQATSDHQASLFGRPDFFTGHTTQVNPSVSRSPSELESLVLGGVADLPGTEEEVTKIDSLLKKQQWTTHVYLGEMTTEKAIKQQKNITLLHIATHGFFIPVENDNQGVMLSPDFRQPEKNPLLRSGLILSGVQKSIQQDRSKRDFAEDGILTAYEVMNLNLDKTELVILSACETGAGEIRNGEGVFGLQRAFLLAGSGNLVMSLWKVDDEATRELMIEFYRYWSKTNDKYDALYKTMFSIKSKWVEPYYWGGFAMIGVN